MTPFIHPLLTTFVLSVTIAGFAVELFKKSYPRFGKVLIAVAVLISILSIYSYHEDQVNDAGRNLSSSFGIIEALIKEGRLEECVEVLEQGSEIVRNSGPSIRERSTTFLSIAYSTHQNKKGDETTVQSIE